MSAPVGPALRRRVEALFLTVVGAFAITHFRVDTFVHAKS